MWEDYIAYVKLNDGYMKKIYTAYNEVIDDMYSEYTERAEAIIKRFENEGEEDYV